MNSSDSDVGSVADDIFTQVNNTALAMLPGRRIQESLNGSSHLYEDALTSLLDQKRLERVIVAGEAFYRVDLPGEIDHDYNH